MFSHNNSNKHRSLTTTYSHLLKKTKTQSTLWPKKKTYCSLLLKLDLTWLQLAATSNNLISDNWLKIITSIDQDLLQLSYIHIF